MGSDKVSMPSTPQFQTDPNVGWSQDNLKKQYDYLIGGLTTNEGRLSGLLGDSVNVSPDVSRLSLQLAQSQLDPAYRNKRAELINTLEANNQLTGSTTASTLANLDTDYMATLTGIQAQYGLADVERALNNRVQLYNTGLNVGQFVGQAGLANQDQMNKFALQNYENQVAAAMMDYYNTTQEKAFWGNLAGGLTGSPHLGAAVGGATGGQTGATAGMNSGWNTSGYMASMFGGGNYAPFAQQSSNPYFSQSLSGNESTYNYTKGLNSTNTKGVSGLPSWAY